MRNNLCYSCLLDLMPSVVEFDQGLGQKSSLTAMSQAVDEMRTQELSASQQKKCVSHGPESFFVIAVIVLVVSERAFFWSTNSTFFGPRIQGEEAAGGLFHKALKPLCQTSFLKI